MGHCEEKQISEMMMIVAACTLPRLLFEFAHVYNNQKECKFQGNFNKFTVLRCNKLLYTIYVFLAALK